MMQNRERISVAQAKRNKTEISLENAKDVAKKCEELMTGYHIIEQKTPEISTELVERYDEQWKITQKEWYNWNIDKIIGWFEYILTANGSVDNKNTIDFDSIKFNLEEDRFKGKYFTSMDDSDLSHYGFENEEDCDLLYERICDLLEKYPLPRKSAKKSLVKIPKTEKEDKKEEKESGVTVCNDDDKQIKKRVFTFNTTKRDGKFSDYIRSECI